MKLWASGAKPERQKVYILPTLQKSNERDQGSLLQKHMNIIKHWGNLKNMCLKNFLQIILMWCNLPEPSTFNMGENTVWATNKENIWKISSPWAMSRAYKNFPTSGSDPSPIDLGESTSSTLPIWLQQDPPAILS